MYENGQCSRCRFVEVYEYPTITEADNHVDVCSLSSEGSRKYLVTDKNPLQNCKEFKKAPWYHHPLLMFVGYFGTLAILVKLLFYLLS